MTFSDYCRRHPVRFNPQDQLYGFCYPTYYAKTGLPGQRHPYGRYPTLTEAGKQRKLRWLRDNPTEDPSQAAHVQANPIQFQKSLVRRPHAAPPVNNKEAQPPLPKPQPPCDLFRETLASAKDTARRVELEELGYIVLPKVLTTAHYRELVRQKTGVIPK